MQNYCSKLTNQLILLPYAFVQLPQHLHRLQGDLRDGLAQLPQLLLPLLHVLEAVVFRAQPHIEQDDQLQNLVEKALEFALVVHLNYLFEYWVLEDATVCLIHLLVKASQSIEQLGEPLRDLCFHPLHLDYYFLRTFSHQFGKEILTAFVLLVSAPFSGEFLNKETRQSAAYVRGRMLMEAGQALLIESSWQRKQAEQVNSLLSPYWAPNHTTSSWSLCWERHPFRAHLQLRICQLSLRTESAIKQYYKLLANKFQQGGAMSKAKPRRVNYRINYCSSEDAEYPVSELVLQSSESKGWQTKRFAPYPQTLIVELLELTLVTNLSFLSHQNKICTKIEIEGKEDHDDSWVRLGYTTLESGVNTNQQSRELRNISLGGRLILLLKFTLHQNYSNHINIFNQIGLIALLVYGEKATVEREMVRDREGAVVASLTDLDRDTILKLKTLQQSKREAAEDHRFEEAKEFKEQLQALQANLKALSILEKEKKEAIKRQEYDVAKEIVERMKRLRGPMLLPPRSAQSLHEHSAILPTPKKSIKSSMDSFSEDPEQQSPSLHHYQLPSRQSQPRYSNRSFDLNTPKKNNSMLIPFDEIKIRPKERYPIEQELQRSKDDYSGRKKMPPAPPKRTNRMSLALDRSPENDEIPNPHALPSVAKLQKLTPQQFDECSKYFPIFNEITFEYLCSKDHLMREKGIEIINEALSNWEGREKKETEEFIVASVYVVRRMMDDKIISVLVGLMDFFGMMMKKFKPTQIGAAAKHVQYILEKLGDYIGHNNEKLKETCQDVLVSLPAHPLTARDLCYDLLCEGIKEKPPKVVTARLLMLARMISKYRLGKEREQLLETGKRYLEDKSSDVRLAAVELMAQASKEIGYENLYHEIESMKPQVVKMIEERIEADGGRIEKVYVKEPQLKPAKLQAQKQPSNPEYYCDYCKLFDRRLQDENYRDKHLYSSCPMIILCRECKQAIEVRNLNTHLLGECAQHKYFKRCPKCKEAVSTQQFADHTKRKECISAKPPASGNRCPLCHEDTEPGEKGWIKHLVEEKCPNDPRH